MNGSGRQIIPRNVLNDRPNIDYGAQLGSENDEKITMLLNALDIREESAFTDISFLVLLKRNKNDIIS